MQDRAGIETEQRAERSLSGDSPDVWSVHDYVMVPISERKISKVECMTPTPNSWCMGPSNRGSLIRANQPILDFPLPVGSNYQNQSPYKPEHPYQSVAFGGAQIACDTFPKELVPKKRPTHFD